MKCTNYPFTTTEEDDQNLYNGNLSSVLPVLERKKFLARKIHKLKKVLKLHSKPRKMIDNLSTREAENERMQCQNQDNEELERKYLNLDAHSSEGEENENNENWENWNACQLCAGKNEYYMQDYISHCGYEKLTSSPSHSICYVFMPDQCEPVPVKLRTARIPGGVMWVSYRPDLDICASNYVCSYTSQQLAQAQVALRPIMV